MINLGLEELNMNIYSYFLIFYKKTMEDTLKVKNRGYVGREGAR